MNEGLDRDGQPLGIHSELREIVAATWKRLGHDRYRAYSDSGLYEDKRAAVRAWRASQVVLDGLSTDRDEAISAAAELEAQEMFEGDVRRLLEILGGLSQKTISVAKVIKMIREETEVGE